MDAERDPDASRRGRRRTVDESVVLDVGLLQTEGLLKPGSSGSLSRLLALDPAASLDFQTDGDTLQLVYKAGAEEAPSTFDTTIRLVRTPAYFGGHRYWLTCPLDPSGRKLARLYLPPGAQFFGCRSCLNLTYKSRNERKVSGYSVLPHRWARH